MPFNCEASQFVDIPLDSVDFDSYGVYRNKHGYTKNNNCGWKCKHIKTCKHNKGQSDCEVVYTVNKYKEIAFILKEQEESTYPKAILCQEYKDENYSENGKRHDHCYVTLNNQEGK